MTRAVRTARAVLAGVLVTAGLVGCSGGGDPADDASPASASTAEPGDARVDLELLPLHVERGDRPHFADEAGREVLLRGVNVIHLGDYHQADPDLAPTLPVTERDWAAMAAVGFDSVRLVLSWSALEPERGVLDDGYVQRIREAVESAKAHGMYVVLDMHQDAWGRYIATPADHPCPEGLEPAIGWDGAPEWATLDDGAETCRSPGQREVADAVRTAFRSFYADRDGIRSALTATWARLAGAFADEPAVAGYDLFNEPNGVDPMAETLAGYTAFLGETITAIRAAEDEAGGFPHVVFVEPIVLFPLPDTLPRAGFSSDPNLAFAPHNYWESISPFLSVEAGMELDRTTASQLGMPFWVGEYGWWDTGDASLGELRRYAVAEDAAFAGGAWWQWRQACGDPHSIGVPGGRPEDQIHLNGVGCPGDDDLGLTVELARVVGRAYPRTSPGRLTMLESDVDRGTLRLAGTAGAGGPDRPLVVWVPGTRRPTVGGSNIADVEVVEVDGGFLVQATAGCDYTLEVGGAAHVTGDPAGC